ATLTAFTARSIARGIALLGPIDGAVVAGGGARNPTFLARLAAELAAPVRTADSLGWSSAFLEAEAFAFLAARSKAGLALTYPGTTGVSGPTTGGVMATP